MAKRSYKHRAWQIAMQLGYGRVMPDVKERIYASLTELEVDNILAECRHMV